jgi:hypothetical protein
MRFVTGALNKHLAGKTLQQMLMWSKLSPPALWNMLWCQGGGECLNVGDGYKVVWCVPSAIQVPYVRIKVWELKCCLHYFLNFHVVLKGHDKFYNNFTAQRLGKTIKISLISEAFVSDMRCRWCHAHTAVAICHSHWIHCRPFCCTKHVNKPKMTADTMASQLWIMMLCSVRRHSCQMHMWVTSFCITYAQV